MGILDVELQECLERAPELLCLESDQESYALTVKMVGGDGLTRKIFIDLDAIIDCETRDFYKVLRVDDHPFEVIKLMVNVNKRTISLNLTAI